MSPIVRQIPGNRREHFRRFMESLATSRPSTEAIAQQQYVPIPGLADFERMVARLDLEPKSAHLVVGGIGAGKTTQLIVATQRLNSVGDIFASYIDVAKHHDLRAIQPGTLVVLAGLELLGHLDKSDLPEHGSVKRAFSRWASGFSQWIEIPDWDPDDVDGSDSTRGGQFEYVTQPGILAPPLPPLTSDVAKQQELLSLVVHALGAKTGKKVILAFDSLDRLSSVDAFSTVTTQDLRALRRAGVGCIVVGPLALLFGKHRPQAAHFDHVYHVSAVDVQGEVGRRVLREIIAARVDLDLFDDEALARVIDSSGGVIRDLLSLARAAGEEAYLGGADRISGKHADLAAGALGRSLILGLDRSELEVLRRVAQTGSFVQASDKDIALLATRRVLEYGLPTQVFRVHPSLLPLLAAAEPAE